MSLKVRVGSAAKDFASGFVSVNGVWKKIWRVLAWDAAAGAWKEAYTAIPPLTVSITPPRIEYHGTRAKYGQALVFNTDTIIHHQIKPYLAQPVGGVPPYQYHWAINGGVELTRQGQSSVGIARTVYKGEDFNGEVHVTVTDAAGTTASAIATYRFWIT